jgi:hypothetical protein
MKKLILSEEELKNILKMYNKDLLGSHSISVKTGISKPTILRILKENGVIMGPSGRRFLGGKKASDKRTYQKHKEKKSEYHKRWADQNKEHLSNYIKEYREKNVDKIKKTKRDYERNRKASDPLYKLITNFRTAIWTVLKENDMNGFRGITRHSVTTKIIKCNTLSDINKLLDGNEASFILDIITTKEMFTKCVCCDKPSKHHCRDCFIYYCSRECQRKDWPFHKKECVEIKNKVRSRSGKEFMSFLEF